MLHLAFLGLVGDFPAPDSGVVLSVSLTGEGKSLRADRLGAFLRVGHIQHKELESLTGRMSFSKTSAFCRFGRGMMQPLYRGKNSAFYQEDLTNADRLVFHRWAEMLTDSPARRAISRRPIPAKIIYTDAAAETMILESLVFGKSEFDLTGTISEAYKEVAPDEWAELFSETSLIYGLELIALIQKAAGTRIDMGRKCITFYIDNNASKMGIIKGVLNVGFPPLRYEYFGLLYDGGASSPGLRGFLWILISRINLLGKPNSLIR